MIGLREHINEAELSEDISPFGEEVEVSRKGSWFARDIDDFFGFQSDQLVQDRLGPCPWRVEDDEIRRFSFPTHENIFNLSLNEIAISDATFFCIETGIINRYSILFDP